MNGEWDQSGLGLMVRVFRRSMRGCWWRGMLLAGWFAGLGHGGVRAEDSAVKADYAAVQTLWQKHCLDCHSAQESEGQLSLEDFAGLSRGGESGPVIQPGKPNESLLVQWVEGRVEADGKKRFMPPGKRTKLEPAEVAVIRQWIAAGAPGPTGATVQPAPLVVPKIEPRAPVPAPFRSLAYSPQGSWIAAGRFGVVELWSVETQERRRELGGFKGVVSSVVFSPDGLTVFGAGGEPGLSGEVRQWRVTDGMLVRSWPAHRDAIDSMALSPDGRVLATGSYDQKIHLWNTENGTLLRTLAGHNGAVNGLSFRPDGQLLASASADRTVKLWDVATGERRDTLSQALKELNAVAFAPDGQRLVSGGGDNRIRVYAISAKAAETTNPLVETRFAHEGSILRLAFSRDGRWLATAAEDRTLKVWDATTLTERWSLERQSDWVSALVFAAEDRWVVSGRLNGTWQWYDMNTGEPRSSAKVELSRVEPPGAQRGRETLVRLVGKGLAQAAEVRFSVEGLRGEWVERAMPAAAAAAGDEVRLLRLTVANTVPRGKVEFWLKGQNGESGRLALQIDDLPQQIVSRDRSGVFAVESWPASLWVTHDRAGESAEMAFHGSAGQVMIFDVLAKGMGSKATVLLTLLNDAGEVLAVNRGYDGGDPFLAYTLPATGRYVLRTQELVLGGSADHVFRLTMGTLPWVTGVYPLSVSAATGGEVELLGYNLDGDRWISVPSAETPGERELPLPRSSWRQRRPVKVMLSADTETREIEPNDVLGAATVLVAPSAVAGRIWPDAGQPAETDLFQFEAKAGEAWVIETTAAQMGSPADTKLEILGKNGQPVPRVWLQAVRNSAVTFRGIDSVALDCRVENWEEMELNQYLYLQGEVVKLFRAPQGPDSGFMFYAAQGRRRCFFDTSATSHAVDESCYIVEAHPPGATLPVNGLPIFRMVYENDDDGERQFGTDSRIRFTAPADGSYWIRVTDTRGVGGDRFVYRLNVRRPKPDFVVRLQTTNLVLPRGSGQSFAIVAERRDGFEGPIRVDISELPPGVTVSTPLVIEAGHTEARGTLFAAADAPEPSEGAATANVLTASASVDGLFRVKAVNPFGRIKLAEPPKLYVGLVPTESDSLPTVRTSGMEPPKWEITLAPGQTVPAWLKVRRNGLDELVTFTVDNLPHGVIVDNIGLNGVLIPKDQSEREIFFTAARWVPETERWCFAVANQAGRQTSWPVLIKIRRGNVASASVRP